MEPARLWLVDDHELLTEALTVRLGGHSDVCVLGRSTSDDPQFGARLARALPAVVTVEVDGPRGDVREIFAVLRRVAPEARVVVLTGSADPELAVAAARLGADGWVPKEATVEQLVGVLHGVGRGEAWWPPELLGPVLRGLRADAGAGGGPLDVLSTREREVLTRMVEGLSGSQIAQQLNLSTNTVRTHTHSVYAKLGVHSRLEAVSVARSAGLRPVAPEPADAQGDAVHMT